MQTTKKFFSALILTLAAGAFLSGHAQNGANNQFIELEYGASDISYPVRIENPQGNECGSGVLDWLLRDKVLVYNTPGGGSSNPDNIKFWSNLWYVRRAVVAGYGGKLAGSGLRTPTARVCVGSFGRFLSLADYRFIYLWRRRPIAGR